MPNQAKNDSKRTINDYSEVMRNEKETDNSLRAFIPKPKNISLDIQEENEKIALVLRQHPITQVREIIIIAGIVFVIPALLNFSGFMSVLPIKFIGAFYILWTALAFGLLVKTFLIWFFNVYIITDERVIDVDFTSMISHDISSAKIENIEDVTVSTAGPIAAIFDYGTILIQTAGEKSEFDFASVPQPAKVTKLLNELSLEEEKEKLEGRSN